MEMNEISSFEYSVLTSIISNDVSFTYVVLTCCSAAKLAFLKTLGFDNAK